MKQMWKPHTESHLVPHQYDPNMRPDSDFLAGDLRFLVPGNQARRLDPRRTPVSIESINEPSGLVLIRIEAFEDRGFIREVPFEDITYYQFARDSAIASASEVARFKQRVQELDRELHIVCPVGARNETEMQVAAATSTARVFLQTSSEWLSAATSIELKQHIGSEVLAQALQQYLDSQDLWELEDTVATHWVFNPSSEIVKGHRIVIAELGLVAYDGKIPRSAEMFAGIWTKQRRSQHIIHRLGFVRALFELAGVNSLRLYRGLTFTDRLELPRNRTFVAATTWFEIARSCFGDHVSSDNAALFRQQVPINRLFMTYFETDHMNRQYKESEVVLFYHSDNPLF
jgi:hypothetical protein